MTTVEHRHAKKIYRLHVTFSDTFGGNRKQVAKYLAKLCAQSGGSHPDMAPGVIDIDVEVIDVTNSVGSCGRELHSRDRE